jgi:hypothetical protein
MTRNCSIFSSSSVRIELQINNDSLVKSLIGISIFHSSDTWTFSYPLWRFILSKN